MDLWNVPLAGCLDDFSVRTLNDVLIGANIFEYFLFCRDEKGIRTFQMGIGENNPVCSYFWEFTGGIAVFAVPLCDYRIPLIIQLFKTECSPNGDGWTCAVYRFLHPRTDFPLTGKSGL